MTNTLTDKEAGKTRYNGELCQAYTIVKDWQEMLDLELRTIPLTPAKLQICLDNWKMRHPAPVPIKAAEWRPRLKGDGGVFLDAPFVKKLSNGEYLVTNASDASIVLALIEMDVPDKDILVLTEN